MRNTYFRTANIDVSVKRLRYFCTNKNKMQHCCKGDERFQWEMPFFRVFQLRNPELIFKIFAQLITSVTPPHMQIFGSVGTEGACLHMREIVIVRRLFFSFFL